MQLPKIDSAKTVDLKKKVHSVKIIGGLIMLILIIAAAVAIIMIIVNHFSK